MEFSKQGGGSPWGQFPKKHKKKHVALKLSTCSET